MIAALLLLAAIQPAASTPDPLEWYGARIGDWVPRGQGQPGYPDWPSTTGLPDPWQEGEVAVDTHGHISSIELAEPGFVNEGGTRPAHPRPQPDRRQKYQADGRAAEAFAVARLGPPTQVWRRQDGPYRWAELHWDFAPRFLRCDGARPIFAAASSHEPSGLIVRARLGYSEGSVQLEVEGNAADARGGPLSDAERSQHAEECRSRVREAEERAHAAERARQDWAQAVLYCRDHADLCSLLPGVELMLGPGTMVISRPCPPGSAPRAVCLETRPIAGARAP